MHMLVSVLQNRLKPIWPSLYHQLKVASHQDGPRTASPAPRRETVPPSAAHRGPQQRWPARGCLTSPKSTASLRQPADMWVTRRGGQHPPRVPWSWVAPSPARRHGWTARRLLCLVAIRTFCSTGFCPRRDKGGPADSSRTAEQRGKRCPSFG